MHYPMVRTFLAPLAAAALLSACGGGISVDIVDDGGFEDSFSSGRTGTVTVASPQDERFSGTYTTDDVLLTRVIRVRAVGDLPVTCRFQFAGLKLVDRPAYMDGEIRYRPDSNVVVSSFVAINGLEYRLSDSPAVTVNHDAFRVRFTDATLSVPRNTTETITMTGFIPYRANDLPPGC
jgi:hypothetical protein